MKHKSIAVILASGIITLLTILFNQQHFKEGIILFSISIISTFIYLILFKNKKPALLKHSIFSDIDYYINFFIPGIESQESAKNNLLKSMLLILFQVMKEKLINQAKQKNIKFNLKEEINFLKQIEEAYVYKWEKNNIPSFVITKYIKWINKYETILLRMLQEIDQSVLYNTDLHKQYTKLNLYKLISVFIILDMEKVINDFNGQIAKYYKNNQGVNLNDNTTNYKK